MTAAAHKPPSLLYRLKFGEAAEFCTTDLTLERWEKFESLMLMAIERGKPLTRAECHAAHNLDYFIGTGMVV